MVIKQYFGEIAWLAKALSVCEGLSSMELFSELLLWACEGLKFCFLPRICIVKLPLRYIRLENEV
jgi:hypothetical protein